MKFFVYFLGICLSMYVHNANAQNSIMAEALCNNGLRILESPIMNMRMNGIPKDSAKKIFDSSFSENITYWHVMIDSVDALYGNPKDFYRNFLSNGKWKEICIHEVQGY